MTYEGFLKKKQKKETWLVSRYRATQEDKTELINFYELEILRRWQTDIGGAVI